MDSWLAVRLVELLRIPSGTLTMRRVDTLGSHLERQLHHHRPYLRKRQRWDREVCEMVKEFQMKMRRHMEFTEADRVQFRDNTRYGLFIVDGWGWTPLGAHVPTLHAVTAWRVLVTLSKGERSEAGGRSTGVLHRLDNFDGRPVDLRAPGRAGLPLLCAACMYSKAS